jgi:hypothetical protein
LPPCATSCLSLSLDMYMSLRSAALPPETDRPCDPGRRVTGAMGLRPCRGERAERPWCLPGLALTLRFRPLPPEALGVSRPWVMSRGVVPAPLPPEEGGGGGEVRSILSTLFDLGEMNGDE